jgi:ABC-type nitrate/sulfonate/bicarbonate transport system permease component
VPPRIRPLLPGLLALALVALSSLPAAATSGEGSVIAPGSLVEAAGFVPGRRIPPAAFVAAALALAALLQATRLVTARGVAFVRGAMTLLGFLVAWELAAALGLITTILLPPPTLVLQRLDALWLNDYLGWHLLATLRRFALSFGLAAAAGFPLGVLVASVPGAFAWLYPAINFVRLIPSPAWAPLAILWFGLGDAPAVFIVSIAVFFPIFLNTIRGIESALPIYREVVRTMGGTRWDEAVHATVPCALPIVLTGVRIGFGLGWVVLAASELVAVDSGVGWLIHTAYTQVDSPAVLAGMALVCWAGLALDTLIRQVERWLVPW